MMTVGAGGSADASRPYIAILPTGRGRISVAEVVFVVGAAAGCRRRLLPADKVVPSGRTRRLPC